MKFMLKLLLNGIIVVPLLMWFSEATFMEAAIAAVILSAIAYLVGDQWILRASNNTVATIADAVLSFVYLWVVADFMDWNLTAMEIATISLVLGVVEAVYHRYLRSEDRAHG